MIVYFHGGGFVIADLDVYDATPRAIAAQTNAIVVSAHYRQAPEHKFPQNYQGATHEFFGMATVVQAARDAQAFVVEAQKRHLG